MERLNIPDPNIRDQRSLQIDRRQRLHQNGNTIFGAYY